MDQRVAYLPNRYTFEGEREQGARHFDDKDPYAQGAAPATTQVPRPLHTPLSAPVGDGVSGITSREGRDSIPHSGNRVEAGHGAHGNGNGHHPKGGKDRGGKHG
jgi:hypothetical protein